MPPFDAIRRRLSVDMRGGSSSQQNSPISPYNSVGTRSPRRSNHAKEEHQYKVEILLNSPVLFEKFKRRASESKAFSNTCANFVLHDFLGELELGGQSAYKYDDDMDTSSNSQSIGVRRNGFGLLQSLRKVPQSPSVPYMQSPRHRFSCPESPSTMQNLSPTKTPLTPISATTVQTSAESTPDESPEEFHEPTRIRGKAAIPACLEQPSF